MSDDQADLPRLPVCVVIPAYNRAAVLPRCVGSVWSQRPALPTELIVVDDNSIDDTATVARRLGARVIRLPTNQGAWAARNAGLRASSCDWVAFLDSDDEWLPDHLAHLWELRDGHALAGAASLHRGGGPHRFHGPVARRPVVLRSPDVLIGTFNFFTASASMVRRDAVLALGGFNAWWGVEDFDLWVRMLEHHSAVCSPRVTVIYHMHDEQLSLHTERMLDGHRAVAEAHRARTGASPVALERWEAVVAWDTMRAALTGGKWCEALRGAASALRGRHRIAGVATQLRWRFVVRRRTAGLGPDGRASVAMLVHDARQRAAVIERFRGQSVRDLSQASLARALIELVWRPAGLTVVSSRRQATLIGLLGIRTLAANHVAETHGTSRPVSSRRRALSGAKRARSPGSSEDL